MISAARANIVLLQQGTDLLQALGQERYVERVPACFNSATGGHMRHIIDHYLALLDGCAAGEIDYEHRARDPLIETDMAYATGVMSSLIERLETLAADGADAALRVRSETIEGAAADSSLLRELEFLISHTVHHYALIAVMCRLLGHVPAADFGMAPSTLKYLQRPVAR